VVKHALAVNRESPCPSAGFASCDKHLFAPGISAKEAFGVHRPDSSQMERQACWDLNRISWFTGALISSELPIRVGPFDVISVRMNVCLLGLRRNTNRSSRLRIDVFWDGVFGFRRLQPVISGWSFRGHCLALDPQSITAGVVSLEFQVLGL
jgi:hypothetical protein